MEERELYEAIARASVLTGVPADMLLCLAQDRRGAGIGPFGFKTQGWAVWGLGDPENPRDAALAAARFLAHALKRLARTATGQKKVEERSWRSAPAIVRRAS